VICPAADDFQVPVPRLQSRRAVSVPSAAKAIVYFVRSSGRNVLPSLFSNLTSCHEVPPRTAAALCGFAGAAPRVCDADIAASDVAATTMRTVTTRERR